MQIAQSIFDSVLAFLQNIPAGILGLLGAALALLITHLFTLRRSELEQNKLAYKDFYAPLLSKIYGYFDDAQEDEQTKQETKEPIFISIILDHINDHIHLAGPETFAAHYQVGSLQRRPITLRYGNFVEEQARLKLLLSVLNDFADLNKSHWYDNIIGSTAIIKDDALDTLHRYRCLYLIRIIVRFFAYLDPYGDFSSIPMEYIPTRSNKFNTKFYTQIERKSGPSKTLRYKGQNLEAAARFIIEHVADNRRQGRKSFKEVKERLDEKRD